MQKRMTISEVSSTNFKASDIARRVILSFLDMRPSMIRILMALRELRS
jgi:hypothetical protein